MHGLLLTKYFFLILFLVMYTVSESSIVIPTMKPNLQKMFINSGEKLDIECSSTRKIKFFYKPIAGTNFDLSKINILPEKKENGIYTMKIQINKTRYYETGSFGCGHNKRDDSDVRWINVEFRSSDSILHDNLLNYGRHLRKSYIEVKKNDSFQITCNHTEKMIIRRYISPWLCCILPIEDEPNEIDTIMIYEKDRRKLWTQGLFGCDHCGKYRNNFMNAAISQDDINGTFSLNLEKKKAVLGDTGWYSCINSIVKKGSRSVMLWTYVYVKPEKYLFVDINDFKAITVDVNKTLTIPCRPKSPNYQVTLYANKTKINDNGNVIFNHSLGFIINNVQLKDNGYYECRITLDGITEEKGFDVLVTEPEILKPTMYPDLSYIELEENQMLNLTCTNTQRVYFLCNPWMFEAYEIVKSKSEVLNEIHTSKLQIKRKPEHTGFYGCGYFNGRNYINIRWIYVYVKAKPRIEKLRINKYYEPKEIAEIQNTVVACPSSDIRSTLEESNPHLEIQNITNIVRNVIPAPSSDLRYRITYQQFVVNIFISLSWTVARNITFTVYNDVGNDSVVVPLYLDGKPPEFGISGPNKKLIVGDALELICIVSLTNSLDRIRWTNSNDSKIKLLDADPRINTRLLEYDDICISILTISSVEKSDENKYYCKIEDTMYNYILNVNELKEPNSSRTNMNKTEAKYENRGKSTVLTCYVDGVPEPIITWSKNNVPINTSYPNIPNDICKYKFLNNNQELQIGYLAESCFGNYSCKADNYLGHWETYQEIIIDDPTIKNIVIFGVTSMLIIITIILIYFFFKIQREKKILRKQLMEGNLQPLNPELPVNEQVDLLGYDEKKWEFSRDKLILGKKLGSGNFGIVMKAKAQGIYGDDDASTTIVAVKEVKKPPEMTNIQALANELKIMGYIGKNDNIVNLLGACTKNITKRELLVIVEYCHFGDLHNYLRKHRMKFINQIDPITDEINISVGSKISNTSANVDKKNNEIKYFQPLFSQRLSSSDQESLELPANVDAFTNNSAQPHFQSNNQRDDYNRDENLKKICTKDLFSWSLQVAKGMEYLSKKKVLHGDLAARNILLAQNNVVKISDFGLAKNICNGIYQKKSNDPLPVKWMAIDSLEGGIFTSQSDVWSFGIVLWEFFSLAETPYAGMDAKDCWLNVRKGYRMKKPEYATNEIYSIMLKCWLENPILRPTFTDLVNDIGDLYNNIDKKDNNDLNTPYVEIKKRQDDGTNNDCLIMNPAPDHPTLSSSKSDHVDEPTININTNLSYVSMN